MVDRSRVNHDHPAGECATLSRTFGPLPPGVNPIRRLVSIRNGMASRYNRGLVHDTNRAGEEKTMNFDQAYRDRRMGAADAAALVHDGDTVVVPTGVGEPPALLAALSARGPELSGVTVSQILPLRKFDYFNPATVDNIRHNAYFFGGPRGPAGRPAGSTTCRPTSRSCRNSSTVGSRRSTWCSRWLRRWTSTAFQSVAGARLHHGSDPPCPCGAARGQSQRAERLRRVPGSRLAGRRAGRIR